MTLVFVPFLAIFALIVIVGIATTVWRVNAARSLARSAGLDPNAAAGLTLTDPTAASAMIIAARLGNRPAGAAPLDAAARLRQLDDLKTQGLITDQEYAEKRAAILNGL